MGGKTEKLTYSGSQPVISGLVTAINVDGAGELRHLSILNDGTSGIVTVCVYADSGLLLTYGQAVLGANGSVPDVDVIGSSLGVSGAVLVSGSPSMNQAVGFASNLTVQYYKTSGTVNLTAIVDINKSIIPT